MLMDDIKQIDLSHILAKMFNQALEIQSIIDSIPSVYRGPGGAIAVLQDGEVIAQKTWGYADIHKRIPMTSKTIMPICSISKQMVCALMLDLEHNPPGNVAAKGPFMAQMEANLQTMLPEPLTKDKKLTVRHLCDMQSGLRDYWAVAMICGAKPDDRFTIEGDGRSILSNYKTFQFEPGTEYSYCNLNFYILGRLIEQIIKRPLPELLQERIFRPRGMTTAQLIPDTSQQPGDCVGYEGNEEFGFLPAVNRIEWSGDAGITASLEDMIAFEAHFDKEWTARERYYHAAKAKTYSDGHAAPYSYGLGYANLVGGVSTVGHGGALRGWRMSRRYAETDRLAVIVMFNSENSKAGKAAEAILQKALHIADLPNPQITPDQKWFGHFLDLDTQLSLTVSVGPAGHVVLRYTRDTTNLRLVSDTQAETDENKATINGDILTVHRLEENRTLIAHRINPDIVTDGSRLQGNFRNEEMETTFVCYGQDDMLYGSFDGPLGQGPANLMKRLGEDVWTWACPRGLDHTPPGDWTVVFTKNEGGAVTGCIIGCWLARRLEFSKI